MFQEEIYIEKEFRVQRFLVLVVLLAFSFSVKAQFARELYFVHFKVKSVKERSIVANYAHIDQVIEQSAYATVGKSDYERIKKEIPHLIKESHPLEFSKISPDEADDYDFPSKDAAYRTYQEVVDELKEHARNYPDIVSLFSFGSTIEGRDIPGIRITAPENRTSGAFIPGIIFTGSHHAREHLSTEVPMNILKYILENYQTDTSISNLISTRDIYFVPIINPDGALHDIKGRKYKYWRKNRVLNASKKFYGVDLNRNYSYGWGTGGSSNSESSDVYMGPKPFSEPETQAVREFIEEHANIRIFLSFHTFSELILYPWGGKSDPVGGRDQLVFEKMAQTMAKWNNYTPEQASDLYIASGDTCDWAYGDHGIFCFTFELSPKSMWNGGFYPGTTIIEKASNVNIKPALYLIEHAADPYGVL